MSTAAEKLHMARVAALGCVACRNEGLGVSPAIVHHIRTGQGRKRASDWDTFPLCPRHHLGYGIGLSLHDGIKTWQAKFGTELELLAQTRRELGVDVSRGPGVV